MNLAMENLDSRLPSAMVTTISMGDRNILFSQQYSHDSHVFVANYKKLSVHFPSQQWGYGKPLSL
jgi:hypothetical protein